MPTAVFNTGLKLAIEQENNIAPGTSTNPHWWQGGTWIPISTDGLPSLQDRQPLIFAAGAAGNRNINARAPVKGRTWSDGGFTFPFAADMMGALLYAAMGTLSTNSVPSTDTVLASGMALAPATSNTIDLSDQPSDGGAIIRFKISTASDAGWISISGISPDGQGLSEIIDFSSAGSFYTRNSYSAIGVSSIIIYSDNEGSVAIDGYKYWEHTFTAGPSNPTLSIERLGDPTAGAASKSFMHTSMALMNMTLNTPAAQRDGLFTGSVEFEGHPTATCDATSQMSTSIVNIWPSWGLSVTRDSTTWNRVTNATLTINAGNRNFRAAAGTQVPQGTFFGPREVTAAIDILVDDEEERNRWLGASSHQMAWNWDSPHKLTAVQNQALQASMFSAYLENIDVSDDDDMFSLAADVRTVESGDAGILRLRLISGVPGIAYGNAVD